MPHYHCPGAKAQLPGAALKLIRAVAGPKLPGGGLDLGLRPGFIQYAEFLLRDTCSVQPDTLTGPQRLIKTPARAQQNHQEAGSAAVHTTIAKPVSGGSRHWRSSV